LINDRTDLEVRWRSVASTMRELEQSIPDAAERAMARAAQWWYSQTLPRIPVRAANRTGQFTRTGRGMLKKSTQPYVRWRGSTLEGGLVFGAEYAQYLIWGTKKIAGGKVANWRHGQGLITSWPAKAAGGNPRGAMPVALPWWQQARDRLLDEIYDAYAWST
jgi:hypothetical protein